MTEPLAHNGVSQKKSNNGSRYRRPVKPSSLFDKVDQLKELVLVLEQMNQGLNISQALNAIQVTEFVNRSTIDNLRKEIESYLDVQFTMKGKRNADVITTNPAVLELIQQFKNDVNLMVAAKDRLIRLRHFPLLVETSIGTIPSVASYFIPSVVCELNSRTDRKYDLVVEQGIEQELFCNLQSQKLDMLLLGSGNARAQQLRLDEIRLKYHRQIQGITFLYRVANQPGPFPELAKLIDNPDTCDSSSLYDVLRKCPIALPFTDGLVAKDEFDQAIFELFRRDNPGREFETNGQRLHLPTTRNVRQYVANGLAIGVGYAPNHVTGRGLGVRDVNGHEVIIGKDSRSSDRVIALIPPSMLSPLVLSLKPISEQTFSLYLRRNWFDQFLVGGLSDIAKTCVDVIREICQGIGTEDAVGQLHYSDEEDGRYLVHE